LLAHPIRIADAVILPISDSQVWINALTREVESVAKAGGQMSGNLTF
jgi:hypothetical protein